MFAYNVYRSYSWGLGLHHVEENPCLKQ